MDASGSRVREGDKPSGPLMHKLLKRHQAVVPSGRKKAGQPEKGKMDDIRMVPESLRRSAERNRGVSEYGNGQQRNGGWQRTPLPFYMTYPLPMTWEEEDTVMRDLDYLIQMYPRQARKYKEMISHILDTMDYNGSMIYDEYPDRLALFQLSEDVWKRIRQEETAREAAEGGDQGPVRGEDYWEHIKELIQILLYYEIFRRRRNASATGCTGCRAGRIFSPDGYPLYGGAGYPGVPFYGMQSHDMRIPVSQSAVSGSPVMQAPVSRPSAFPSRISQPPTARPMAAPSSVPDSCVAQAPLPPMPLSQTPMRPSQESQPLMPRTEPLIQPSMGPQTMSESRTEVQPSEEPPSDL